MSRRKWYAAGVVAVVAALALGLALGLGGGQEQSAPLAQGGLPSGGGLNEGIQVHGHWTLEVRDPDGSLVSHNEFENALQDGGQMSLAEIFNGNETVGYWAIGLYGGASSPFRDGGGNPANGYITEPCPNSSGPNWFYNLNRSVNASYVITLTGWAQAQAAGNITKVRTNVWTCNNVSPGQCNCSNWYGSAVFTEKSLPEAVALAANQFVTATVNISFQ